MTTILKRAKKAELVEFLKKRVDETEKKTIKKKTRYN